MSEAGASGRQPIRSYVLRAGRITRAQRRALDELMPRYGLPFTPQALDLDAVFGRRAPRVLEIGFGNGNTLLELAARTPAADFIGVEVHPPGVGHCLLGIEARSLTNVRLIAHDAVEVLGLRLQSFGFARRIWAELSKRTVLFVKGSALLRQFE